MKNLGTIIDDADIVTKGYTDTNYVMVGSASGVVNGDDSYSSQSDTINVSMTMITTELSEIDTLIGTGVIS